MQTSLRRQRRRRLGDRRRPRGNGATAAKAVAVAIPLILFTVIALLGVAGATASVAAYTYLARDLEDPKTALDDLGFTQQTAVFDRTGKVQLARLGDDRRQVVTFADIPPAVIDATTSVEDKTFWENSGFDPAGFVAAAIDTINGNDRGGSTITQQLVRARLLPATAFEGSVYERKAKEIIQSIRLTEAYPGETGKQTIIEKYLNQNFYGNRSYGVAAAAQSYWRKDLGELTLAQAALLAGIPQSPTRFDLVKNAVVDTYKDSKGEEQERLVVPPTSEIVQRRNFILDLMKSRSVLTSPAGGYEYAGKHFPAYTDADYEAAKTEPVILASQAADQWRAPQFVWKVRDELGQILCGDSTQCEKIDTGGYTVRTTLDYRMQRIVEKWVYAAAIVPNSRNPTAILKNRRIPRSEWGWITRLAGHNLHNAAAGVVDYRTGEVLAYSGSASYTAKGNKKFRPQFDVLSDAYRQPGSSIKPLVYLTGINDETMTAATMFMDVVTNFASPGSRAFYPTQADGAERGPVRLRSALQFSLNIPAIKAGIMNGIDHTYNKFRDYGLSFLPGTAGVVSEGIGTLGTHPIEMISAYGAIADGGVLMPRHMIVEVTDENGKVVWPLNSAKASGERVASRQAAYIMTDILAGNTVRSVNPFWGKWRITDGVNGSKVRPAAYKTGTTSDNKDVHAYGYLAPPSNKNLPALVAGVWMGNSDNSSNDGKLSLDTSAPLWSAILSDVSKGMPIEGFGRTRPKGLETARVDAFTGMKPGPTTRKTVEELFIPGTVPRRSADVSTSVKVDAASGLRWREGCAGPEVTRAFIDFSNVESGYRSWQRADIGWQARAARGPGVGGGPKGTHTAYLYGGGFYPFGASWGGRFAPTKTCKIAPPEPTPCVSIDPFNPCPTAPPEESPTPDPGDEGNGNGGPGPNP